MSNSFRFAVLIAAATLTMTASADNAAWLKAKNPALNRTTSQPLPDRADGPAAGSIEAWKLAKFPALRVTDSLAAESSAAAASPPAGSIEAWKRAKYPHLQKTGKSR